MSDRKPLLDVSTATALELTIQERDYQFEQFCKAEARSAALEAENARLKARCKRLRIAIRQLGKAYGRLKATKVGRDLSLLYEAARRIEAAHEKLHPTRDWKWVKVADHGPSVRPIDPFGPLEPLPPPIGNSVY